MKAKRKNIQPKWKVYILLTVAIAVGTIALEAGMMLASYPTQQHREVASKITELDNKSFGSQNPDAILNSQEYKKNQDSIENVYSTRMGFGSGALSVIINIAIVVATYRYLRRNLVTRKPIGATVLIVTIASLLTAVPSFYLSSFLIGSNLSPVMLLLLAASIPFAIGFSVLATFLVAKATEWHYDRSHGFIED